MVSVLGAFLIDYHIMRLENKINLHNVHVTAREKENIFEKYKMSWFLVGSVGLLFVLYFQFRKENYMIIIPFSLFYLFLVLGKTRIKNKISLYLINRSVGCLPLG